VNSFKVVVRVIFRVPLLQALKRIKIPYDIPFRAFARENLSETSPGMIGLQE
jgi:hypothetical protein